MYTIRANGMPTNETTASQAWTNPAAVDESAARIAESFQRATLYEACKKSQVLSNIDYSSVDTKTLRELVNRYNAQSINHLPVLASKYLVKIACQFVVGRFPNLGRYVNPDNIRVAIEDDELLCLSKRATVSKWGENIVFVVGKNIVLGLMGDSIQQLRELIADETGKTAPSTDGELPGDKKIRMNGSVYPAERVAPTLNLVPTFADPFGSASSTTKNARDDAVFVEARPDDPDATPASSTRDERASEYSGSSVFSARDEEDDGESDVAPEDNARTVDRDDATTVEIIVDNEAARNETNVGAEKRSRDDSEIDEPTTVDETAPPAKRVRIEDPVERLGTSAVAGNAAVVVDGAVEDEDDFDEFDVESFAPSTRIALEPVKLKPSAKRRAEDFEETMRKRFAARERSSAFVYRHDENDDPDYFEEEYDPNGDDGDTGERLF